MTDEREAERKYEAPPGFVPPAVPELGEWGEPRTFTLRAAYYDTAEHALGRAKWTLRRRTGGHDAGWHLKSPATDGVRIERRLPDAPEPPAEFADLIAGITGGGALEVVAVLTTERTETDLRHDDVVRAHLCDDLVTADVDGIATSWREVEVELAPQEPLETLDAVDAAVRRAGGRPAAYASKVGRALAAASARPGLQDPAICVVLPYLTKQIDTLTRLADGVRADAPDAVHKSRVACRRLRGLLRTFAPLFQPQAVAWLTTELRWYGEVAGRPRDAEVLLEHLEAALADLPGDHPAAAAERLSAELGERHARAHAALVVEMGRARYAALRAVLDAFADEPPLSPAASEPAGEVLGDCLEDAQAKVRRRFKKAGRHPKRLESWHEVRKAAKAMRYCCEALVDAAGAPAAEAAKRWEAVTEALGDVQDTVVAEETLAELRDGAEPHARQIFHDLAQAQRAHRADRLQAGGRAVQDALADDLAWLA